MSIIYLCSYESTWFPLRDFLYAHTRVRCLQHPYLYDDDIEPRGLAPKEAHEKLIDASAKLRLLKILLSKLKARGHRILLFSQVFYS